MVILKKFTRFPVLMAAFVAIIAAWWTFFIIPAVIADVKADVVRIGSLPEGYKLSNTERADDGITYFYKDKNGGYITLLYMRETDMSLKDYLEAQDVYAKYTTIITPKQGGMWCLYIYSKGSENVGVVDPGDGLFIISSNMGSYELGEVVRSVSIVER